MVLLRRGTYYSFVPNSEGSRCFGLESAMITTEPGYVGPVSWASQVPSSILSVLPRSRSKKPVTELMAGQGGRIFRVKGGEDSGVSHHATSAKDLDSDPASWRSQLQSLR